jgi:signal transduction histidine kinase
MRILVRGDSMNSYSYLVPLIVGNVGPDYPQEHVNQGDELLPTEVTEAFELSQAPALATPTTSSCSQVIEEYCVTITDNGCAVTPKSIDQIFVPFFSIKPGGSGIGLSLARQIALAHGGGIDVEHRQSGGTAFTLILPVRQPT